MSAVTRDIPPPAQLRSGSLSLVETIGQSVANISPTLTPALNIAVVAGLAGTGTWLSYLISTIGLLFVAVNIGSLAKRHPLAGSYFVYIGRTLGPLAGMVAGWSIIAAYLFTAIAVTVSSEIFLGDMLTSFGLKAMVPPGWLFDLVFCAIVGVAAYSDVRLSSRMGLIMEGFSVLLIVIITGVVIAKNGSIVDHVQFSAESLKPGPVMSALTFSVFCFVGFESAATLAKEARDPTRTVPLAITLSAGIVGLFFVALSYFMLLGMGDDAKALGASTSPFTDLTARAGLPWAAGIVYFAALISSSACALATINAASRMMFSMGRYQFLPRSMGMVHAKHQTPHFAVITSTVFTLVVSLLLLRFDPLDAFGYTGTFATFGFLVIYLLICVVSPIDARRAGKLTPTGVIVGITGVALMGFVIFGSLYPVPPYPYNLLPYLFGAYLLIGIVWFAILRARAPQALAGIQHDLEG
ncbi:MAG TPA: APC family permease [Acetobacteraceae bacterium]|nr:APC family permease [Acetobacteraceae bacterium]